MPVPKGSGQHGRPAFGQAAHIIRKFGGEAKLAALIGCSRITCFRWQYQPPHGTNGLIPNHQQAAINKVARLQGVLLTPDDWAQRRLTYDTTPEPDLEPVHAGGKSLEELLK